jgi:hypothetical protein
MSIIEGAANHKVTTTKNGATYGGPYLDLSVAEGNLLYRALVNGQASAAASIDRAQAEHNLEMMLSAVQAYGDAGVVVEKIRAAHGDEGAAVEGAEAKQALDLDPFDLSVSVTALLAYRSKIEAAMDAVAAGNYTVVDIAEGDEIGDKEIPLADYNARKDDQANAGPVAEKLAAYLRAVDPESVAGSKAKWIETVSAPGVRESLQANKIGVTNQWNAMLETAAVMFGVDADVLEAMVESHGVTRN